MGADISKILDKLTTGNYYAVTSRQLVFWEGFMDREKIWKETLKLFS